MRLSDQIVIEKCIQDAQKVTADQKLNTGRIWRKTCLCNGRTGTADPKVMSFMDFPL